MTLNIYEATRSIDNTVAYPNLPTVLRPIFTQRPNGDIYIDHYEDVTGANFKSLVPPVGALKWCDLYDPNDRPSGQTAPANQGSAWQNANFYDIPLLFGARKGIPNFNEFTNSARNAYLVCCSVYVSISYSASSGK